MDTEVLTIIVSLVAIVIAGYSVYKTSQAGVPINRELISGALVEATGTAQELTAVALTAVRASEQLYRSGKITRDQRFSEAISYMRTWFPDLDEDTLVTNLEAAVLVVNALVDALPENRPLQGENKL